MIYIYMCVCEYMHMYTLHVHIMYNPLKDPHVGRIQEMPVRVPYVAVI